MGEWNEERLKDELKDVMERMIILKIFGGRIWSGGITLISWLVWGPCRVRARKALFKKVLAEFYILTESVKNRRFLKNGA